MPTPNRLTWTKMVPEPAELYAAECGPYIFEITKAPEPGTGYLLQMLETRPKDWPLVVWEMDGYSFDEAKDRAERLADRYVPVIMPEHKHLGLVESIVPLDPPRPARSAKRAWRGPCKPRLTDGDAPTSPASASPKRFPSTRATTRGGGACATQTAWAGARWSFT